MRSSGDSVDQSRPSSSERVPASNSAINSVIGDLDVNHYKLRLTSREQILDIVPEHVTRITNRSEAAERATAITHSDLYSGIGRIYREDPRPGCTGAVACAVIGFCS